MPKVINMKGKGAVNFAWDDLSNGINSDVRIFPACFILFKNVDGMSERFTQAICLQLVAGNININWKTIDLIHETECKSVAIALVKTSPSENDTCVLNPVWPNTEGNGAEIFSPICWPLIFYNEGKSVKIFFRELCFCFSVGLYKSMEMGGMNLPGKIALLESVKIIFIWRFIQIRWIQDAFFLRIAILARFRWVKNIDQVFHLSSSQASNYFGFGEVGVCCYCIIAGHPHAPLSMMSRSRLPSEIWSPILNSVFRRFCVIGPDDHYTRSVWSIPAIRIRALKFKSFRRGIHRQVFKAGLGNRNFALQLNTVGKYDRISSVHGKPLLKGWVVRLGGGRAVSKLCARRHHTPGEASRPLLFGFDDCLSLEWIGGISNG